MRRKDREISGRENIEPILQACRTCRLAMIAEGAPYVIPLNFGYTWDDDGLTLYFHSGVKGKKIVSILSGGNMDIITMSSVVQHGLIQRDRIFSVSVLLPDKPGELVRTAKTVADAQGNVIKLEHNQFVSTNRNAAVELRLTIEAFGTEHKHEIMQALEDEGLRPREIGAKLY